MIVSKKELTLAEVKEYSKELDNKTFQDYIKSYAKLSKDKALKLIEELTALNNHKLKEEHIVKIVDFLPQDAEDLNKILLDVTLSEEEINAILNIVKNY
jgi:DNA-directed RNA polymerase subunit F